MPNTTRYTSTALRRQIDPTLTRNAHVILSGNLQPSFGKAGETGQSVCYAISEINKAVRANGNSAPANAPRDVAPLAGFAGGFSDEPAF